MNDDRFNEKIDRIRKLIRKELLFSSSNSKEDVKQSRIGITYDI